MNLSSTLVSPLVAALVLSPAVLYGQPEHSHPSARRAVPSTRLLLPLYEVDTTDPLGVTTVFAVRNENGDPVELDIAYFEPDSPQAPQRTDRVTLAGKAVTTVNIRLVQNLEVVDGFARGYVVISSPTADALIHGDYFQVTVNQDFATGARLVNFGSDQHNELCSLFSMRFLNGGGFDSGTLFHVWLDVDEAPSGADPVFSYFVYDQEGELVFNSGYFEIEATFTVSADVLQLVSPDPEDFGAIEFQLAGGMRGHVSATLSASNRYSVSYEATCLD